MHCGWGIYERTSGHPAEGGSFLGGLVDIPCHAGNTKRGWQGRGPGLGGWFILVGLSVGGAGLYCFLGGSFQKASRTGSQVGQEIWGPDLACSFCYGK